MSRPPQSNRPQSVVYVQSAGPTNTGNKAISAGWWVLIFGFIVACIPVLGMLAWVIGGFLCLAAFILSIIGMANGRIGGGIFLLCGALIGAPLAYVVTPIISMAVVGKATEDPSKASKPSTTGSEAPPAGYVPRDYKPEAK
jgi:hypothetical protein